MANIGKMLKQAQQMQSRMAKLQEDMEKLEKSFAVGGGAVEVTARGDHSIVSISIKPEAVDLDDIEGLEDLLLTAANGALEEVKKAMQSEMSKITGGLNLPGLM